MYLLSANMTYKQLSMVEFSLTGIKRNKSCFAGGRMATLSWRAVCFEVLQAILEKRLDTFVGSFFGRSDISFRFGLFVFYGGHFWLQFLGDGFYLSLG